MKYTEQTFLDIGNRIRTARNAKRWSQDDFIEELAKHGCRIARNRLSKIENGSRKTLDLTVLSAVCEIFGWDMGHLFGEYEEKTQLNRIICAETGLSEKALEKIKLMHEYDSRTWWLDTVNKAIEHPDFVDFVHAATEYTDIDSRVTLVGSNIAFTERESSSKDIAAVKAQRLLFRILDAIPERENDLRPLYSMLFSFKDQGGWSEAEFTEHLAKLDHGDLSDFQED